MSISEAPRAGPRGAATAGPLATVDVTCNMPDATFSLIDSRFLQVARTAGALQTDVPAGIYELQVRAGPMVESRLLSLRAGGRHVDRIVMSVPAMAPIEGASTTREAHSQAAYGGSLELASGIGAGAGLVLQLRRLRLEDNRPVDPSTLQLLDSDLRRVPPQTWSWREDPANGQAIATAVLPPGGYVLRTTMQPADEPAAVFDQSLWLCGGWQSLVFIRQREDGPDTPSASVHMRRAGVAWNPYDRVDGGVATVAENVLSGLRQGRDQGNDQVVDLVLDGDVQDPMLGIYLAHALLIGRPRRGSLATDRYEAVVDRLLEWVPDHPDVAALALRGHGSARGRSPGVTWPPMLAASYRNLLLPADRRADGVIVDGSLAEAVSAFVRTSGVWLCWMAIPGRSEAPAEVAQPPQAALPAAVAQPPPTPPAPAVPQVAATTSAVQASGEAVSRSVDAMTADSGPADTDAEDPVGIAAAQRLLQFVHSAASLEDRSPEDVLASTSPERLAAGTGLTLGTLRRATRAIRSRGGPGRGPTGPNDAGPARELSPAG